jgi:hypothetical protein
MAHAQLPECSKSGQSEFVIDVHAIANDGHILSMIAAFTVAAPPTALPLTDYRAGAKDEKDRHLDFDC